MCLEQERHFRYLVIISSHREPEDESGNVTSDKLTSQVRKIEQIITSSVRVPNHCEEVRIASLRELCTIADSPASGKLCSIIRGKGDDGANGQIA